MKPDTTEENEQLGINRRSILKTVGATAAAGSLFVGTASAALPPEELRFCGCSQVCIQGDKPFDIYIAWEDENGVWQCTRPHSDKDLGGNLGGGEPFCFELTDETRDMLGVPDDAKIVGVESGPHVFCNPNTCAQKAQAALEAQTDGTTCSQTEFSCVEPTGDHEVEDGIHTSGCNVKKLTQED